MDQEKETLDEEQLEKVSGGAGESFDQEQFQACLNGSGENDMPPVSDLDNPHSKKQKGILYK